MKATGLAVLALALAACNGPGGSRPAPQTRLEQQLFFAERDVRGGAHPISAKDAPASEEIVERTADGATLDVNSKLQVRIGGALAAAGSSQPIVPAGPAAALKTDIQALTEALTSIALLEEANARAIRAWERYDAAGEAEEDSDAYQEFVLARTERAKAQLAILEPVRRLWPMARRDSVDDLVERLMEGDPEAQATLAHELQGKLDELASRSAKFVEDVRERSRDGELRLRIEAFLIPSSGSQNSHAVHVPGYDDLDQGEIRRIDPLGLRLTPAERKALQELESESRRLAAALQRVHEGEASWKEAFADSSDSLFQGLTQLLNDLDQLRDLDERARRTRAAFETFRDELRNLASALAEQKSAEWEAELAGFLEDSRVIASLTETIETLRQLREEWRGADLADIPELALRTLEAAGDLAATWDDDAREELLESLRGLLDSLEGSIRDLKGDARDEVQDLWKRSALRGELIEWRSLLSLAHDLLRRMQNALGVTKRPLSTDLTNAHVIDVPIGEARDTEIDLRRTTRVSGDSLAVRARLLGPDDKDLEPPLEATFELAKLGWHADLVPSVVFVEGDTVVGSNDSGGFSTALNWLWSYGPRDDEDDRYLSRSLDWSAGLHAVFLNFGPDHDAEIGLGLTGGLWDNRIQVGAGYNALADERDDGRFYYFIGSSLVPLLQALTRSTN